MAPKKVILVTGASTGIGKATANHFAKRNYQVIAVARDAAKAKGLDSSIDFREADVTASDQIEQLCRGILDQYGRFDFAFNNAGVFFAEQPMHAHATDTWHSIIDSNLSSVYYCMKFEIQAMLGCLESNAIEYASIINNASIVGHRGSASSGPGYTAAKHGVIGLTRQAALTYSQKAIRVNAVSPGPTLTEATRAGLQLSDDELGEKLSALNPRAQLVPLEEIAATVEFLCSPAASMINGHDIPLDGGQLAKL